jgi:hypothetical protein
MTPRLLYFFILVGMGMNGALYLAWFLTPPNPDRIGYWFWIYFAVFPLLGSLGILALLQNARSKWVGGLVLIYVGILTLLANSYRLRLSWLLAVLPQGSYETLHIILFVATLLGLLVFMPRR